VTFVSRNSERQYLRGVNLLVKGANVGRALAEADSDEPDLRIRFRTHQQDAESPNNADIRVYNLAESTVREIRAEYDSVVLQAGYRDGAVGTIFAGTIKQFRIGRENNIDSYLDLLVSDGDIGYNFGVIASTLAKGATLLDVAKAAAKAMGTPLDEKNLPDLNGTELLRGKVLFGMARTILRGAARSADSTWSIDDGRVRMTPLSGYLPGEAVTLNALTGLVGVPELTDQGVHARSLLNPKLRVGGLVRINNRDINQLVQRTASDPTRFDSRTGFQKMANLSRADGLYRLYAVEHSGDTRGAEWFSDLTMLAVNSNAVQPYG